MIRAVIFDSVDQPMLKMEPEIEQTMKGLRQWMFENVYISGEAKTEEWKVNSMIRLLFDFYMKHPDEMTDEYTSMLERNLSNISMTDPDKEHKEEIARQRSVCDYIAGMTDDYCTNKFMEYFVPKGWKKY